MKNFKLQFLLLSFMITILTSFCSCKTKDTGNTTFTVKKSASKQTQIIAHRGYWKETNEAQNSIGALIKAQELGIYGSEFDVWITADDVVVLNHDPTINGIRIETSNYDVIKDITLSNGEKIPTLRDYLLQGKKDTQTKLILEIKTHSSLADNHRVCDAVVNMVKAENMTDQVEYIAFNIDVCKRILEKQPDAIVAYLNGDMTPQSLYSLGIKGIDYKLSVIKSNKNWIFEAHELGMTVNVWTVNGKNNLLEVINYGVDFITTDNPELAKQLVENY